MMGRPGVRRALGSLRSAEQRWHGFNTVDHGAKPDLQSGQATTRSQIGIVWWKETWAEKIKGFGLSNSNLKSTAEQNLEGSMSQCIIVLVWLLVEVQCHPVSNL